MCARAHVCTFSQFLTRHTRPLIRPDQVIILNFFADSPVPASVWRSLLGDDFFSSLPLPADAAAAALERSSAASGYLRAVKFDPEAHVALAEELKHLYTGARESRGWKGFGLERFRVWRAHAHARLLVLTPRPAANATQP